MTRGALSWCSVGTINPSHRLGDDAPHPESHRRILALVHPGESVLDVGCSTGRLAAQLKAKQCFVVGTEIDPEAAAIARQRNNMDVFLVTSERSGLPESYRNAFDVVIAADVIEHTPDPYRFVTDLLRYVRPGGRFIVSIPNVAHWTVRLDLLLGRWEYRPSGLLDASHLRFFTFASAKRLLWECGLTLVSITFTTRPMLRASRLECLDRLHWRARQFREVTLAALVAMAPWSLVRLRPTLFAWQFIIEARKSRPCGD
jgi:methionine biosynthesis protein MetW